MTVDFVSFTNLLLEMMLNNSSGMPITEPSLHVVFSNTLFETQILVCVQHR